MSIKNDINQSIKFVRRIGVSKKDYRKNEKEHFIHSHSQLKKTKQISHEFGRFCKDNYSINNLHDVKEEHYRHFLATKSDTTAGHQRNIETALQQLQKGLHERAEKYDREPTTFMSERLTKPAFRGENVKDRSYTTDEINTVKNGGVTADTKISIELMEKLGLRVSESCSVTVENIDFEKSEIFVIGKGGLPRKVPFKDEFKVYLERLTKNMHKGERLVKTAERTVSANCKKIADKNEMNGWTGTHGFRHSYARNEINEKMTNEEREMFQRCIENYAEGKQFDYAIRTEQRDMYNTMKYKMDQVHKSLGHGKGRFDLALVYMR